VDTIISAQGAQEATNQKYFWEKAQSTEIIIEILENVDRIES